MIAEHGLVPFPTVKSDRVASHLKLPDYVDADQIGVNLHKIHQWMKLSGIAHLGIKGDTDDSSIMDSTQTEGSRRGKRQKVPTHSELLTPLSEDHVFHGFNWTNATINLKISEIARQISEEGKDDSGSSDVWARHLNRSLKAGIRSAGTNHLVFGMKKRTLAGALAFNGVWWTTAGLQEGSLATYEFVFNLGAPFILSKFTDCSWGTFRPSFIGAGPQVDRALLLKAWTKTATIVKPLKPEGE